MYLYKYYFDSLKMFLMSQSWMWVVTINQQVNIHKLACLIRTNTDKVRFSFICCQKAYTVHACNKTCVRFDWHALEERKDE